MKEQLIENIRAVQLEITNIASRQQKLAATLSHRIVNNLHSEVVGTIDGQERSLPIEIIYEELELDYCQFYPLLQKQGISPDTVEKWFVCDGNTICCWLKNAVMPLYLCEHFCPEPKVQMYKIADVAVQHWQDVLYVAVDKLFGLDLSQQYNANLWELERLLELFKVSAGTVPKIKKLDSSNSL